MIALILGERRSSQRSHFSVDRPSVITLLLERDLDTGHDLFGRESAVTIDRLVVLIIRVGIVTPGRIPPAVVPAPPTEIEKDDRSAMIPPPVMVVVMMMIVNVGHARLRTAADMSVPIPETGGSLRIESVFDSDVNGRGVLRMADIALKRTDTVQISHAGMSGALHV